jgi:hypothetical protein
MITHQDLKNQTGSVEEPQGNNKKINHGGSNATVIYQAKS